MLSRTLRQWIRKPLKSKDFLGNVDELYQDSGLLVSLYKQKRRQKDMQRQLEKLTDLVKLIVQKMDIHTEADVDDAPHTGPINMEKLQQIIIAARRFSRVPQRNRLQQQQQQQSQNFLDSKEQ
ncbi:unnamed protein product [Didymodactylos carnosus]|nr:unnamed protein product [Didymodactylos carnosus]